MIDVATLSDDQMQQDIHGVHRCPACGAFGVTDFFEVHDVPVHVGLFYGSAREATQAPSGDIALSYCQSCGFIHNRLFDPSLINFSPGYEVGLQYSETFQKFIEGVANRLIARFGLKRSRILEIGCGNGFFLKLLCNLCEGHGIGVDPAVPTVGDERAGRGTVHFIRDYFDADHAKLEADLICCLSVFEDIPNPGEFLRILRSEIKQRKPAVYFEVFNAVEAIERRETWSVHYEQCNYYSERTLRNLFLRNHFDVLQSGTCYEGGQYVFVEAVPAEMSSVNATAVPLKTDGEQNSKLPESIRQFDSAHQDCLEFWNRKLTRLKNDGKKVVLWGSGGKGIMFLNSVEAASVIQYVVEINPNKHGKFIAGTGQQIVPPEFLAEYRPDVIVITNALYEPEMKKQARDLGVDAEFLIAGDCEERHLSHRK
ncbi:class I SAM-dependent methyltransferase [Stratiformator vulcanicus]|uniref:C-methyltransferase domain-containing protein n=1 Tax=Stratiformator vulcanicus TaxID=2527980 RepID=A0A517QWF1_9PLAN|nr:class I SAM-dependent methyltransferase [Stratiformator vulcanicus]QDT35903.1 hypothetical protein Pan189_02560 [Stratiformator vulcanicus]